MIIELKEVKEIRLKSVRVDRTPQQRTITIVTEEGQTVVMYLPEGCPFVEVGWTK